MAILTASYFLNFVITSIGLTRQISDAVLGLQLSPLMTLMLVIVFYLILGCFMETLSMMVATVRSSRRSSSRSATTRSGSGSW